MPRKRIRSPQRRDKVVFLTGGLNEGKVSLELSPGELTNVQNYEEVLGEYAGYRSVPGYERFSGFLSGTSASTFSWASEVSVTYDADGTVTDDSAREAWRSLISPVGVSGVSGSHASGSTGSVLGCWWYKEEIFAVRYKVASEHAQLYKGVQGTTSGTGGWTEVSGWPQDINVNTYLTEPYRTDTGRMSEAPSAAPNQEICVVCNGFSYPFILYTDGNGDSSITQLTPEDHGIDSGVFPIFGKFWNDRLFLVYPGGHLRFSVLGLFDFSGDTGLAGEHYFGSPITNIVEVAGDALVVFLEKGIKVLKKINPTQANAYSDVEVETFSNRSNAYNNTGTRLLGDIIFAGDRGVSLFSQSDTYGDFNAASLTKKIQATYIEKRTQILYGLAHREKNQYHLFYSDGTGLILSFNEKKEVEGATKFAYAHEPTCVSIGKDSSGTDTIIFGTSSGYLMVVRDEAQSFDGTSIKSLFTTSYHAYGYPTNYKHFKRILFEISGQKGIEFSFRPNFDYRGEGVVNAASQTPSSQGTGGGVWGIDRWGNFVYKLSSIELEWLYITGHAMNMSVSWSCDSLHYQPHIVHNFTTTFQLRSYKE